MSQVIRAPDSSNRPTLADHIMRPTCLERLITALTGTGVGVYEEEDFLFFSREQNVRGVLFWDTDGLFHIGYQMRQEDTPTATLSTPHQDVALRWLICRIANRYREKQKWPYLLPLRTVSGFAAGWSAEQTSEQTVLYSIKATGRLIRPDGTPVDMDMTTAFPHAPELAALSHLMHLTPDQVLDAYLAPDGEPLNHLLEHENPIATMGQDFQHLTQARGDRTTPCEDGFIFPNTYSDWVPHFYIEDGCWRFGHTERGEKRPAEILSTDRDIVLRWIAHELLNVMRFDKGWPSILTYKTDPALLPGWQVQKLYDHYQHSNHGRLISPDNIHLPMVMHTVFPRHENLNTLSHLMPLTLTQVINSFLAEDGGNLHDALDPTPAST